jgi:hypothetical protein
LEIVRKEIRIRMKYHPPFWPVWLEKPYDELGLRPSIFASIMRVAKPASD